MRVTHEMTVEVRRLKELSYGKCDSCEMFSSDLRFVNGKLICEECRDEFDRSGEVI